MKFSGNDSDDNLREKEMFFFETSDLNHTIDKEIEESTKWLERKHDQIRWYSKAYGLIVISSCSGFAYLIKENFSFLPRLALIFGIVTFISGWLFISALNNIVPIIILIHKHLANIRQNRKKIFKDLINGSYSLPTQPLSIKVPGVYSLSPYYMLILNYFFLLFPTYYFYKRESVVTAECLVLFLGVVSGIFYPSSCISIRGGIKSVEKAIDYEDFITKLSAFYNARKGPHTQPLRAICTRISIYSGLTLLGISIFSWTYTIDWFFNNWFWLLYIIFIFVSARVLRENHPLFIKNLNSIRKRRSEFKKFRRKVKIIIKKRLRRNKIASLVT